MSIVKYFKCVGYNIVYFHTAKEQQKKLTGN